MRDFFSASIIAEIPSSISSYRRQLLDLPRARVLPDESITMSYRCHVRMSPEAIEQVLIMNAAREDQNSN